MLQRIEHAHTELVSGS